MILDRLAHLRQLLADEPHDPFNAYALALELRAVDPTEALGYFDHLLARHPTYLATYYQAAALFADLNQPDRAFAVYEQGIVLATDQKNNRTRQELERARQALEEELND